MGGKRVSQKNGGPRRPASHSGKRACSVNERERRWEACRRIMAAERETLVSERTSLSSELEKVRTEREKIAMELEAERGKTLVLAGRVDDLKAQVRSLADLSQQQQLDLEWVRGLRREGVPAPSILRRCRQRVG